METHDTPRPLHPKIWLIVTATYRTDAYDHQLIS